MPLIPNYIARFRTHSQSTAVASSSHTGPVDSPAVPTTTGPESAHSTADPPTIETDRIGRKIHPDVSALLKESAAAVKTEAPGPRPPKGRSRSAGQLVSKRPQGVPLKIKDETTQKTDLITPEPDIPNEATPRSPLISRILSTPILGGLRSVPITPSTDTGAHEPSSGEAGTHWSTFGRRRLRSSPAGELGTLRRRKSGSKVSLQSKRSKLRAQRGSTPVTPSTTRAPSRVPTAADTHSPTESPAGTVSSSSGSKAYSQHSQSVRSRRPPHAYPEPIPDIEPSSSNDPQTPPAAASEETSGPSFTPLTAIGSPRPTKPHLDGSPRTFGRVTPKRAGISSMSIPKFDFGPQATPTPVTPPQKRSARFDYEPALTFPLRSRKVLSGSWNIIKFPSLPSLSSIHSPIRPRAEDIFRDREFGIVSGRRTSAEWCAGEAMKASDDGEAVTWPAVVSREIVRLSLTSQRGAESALPVFAGNTEGVSEADELGRFLGSKNPTLFGSTGEEQLHFRRVGRGQSVPIIAAPTSVSLSSSPPPLADSLGPAIMLSPDDATTMATDSAQETLGGNLIPHLSVTGPTPIASPSGSRIVSTSDPDGGLLGGDPVANNSNGKRKQVESEDEGHVNELEAQELPSSRRGGSKRNSDASHAPSSFRHSKRIRLSTPSHSPPHDHPSSAHYSPPGTPRSRPPSSLRSFPPTVLSRTLSQSSIPLSAIVSPKPPSVDGRSGYHMRDPALPPSRRQSTQWTGGARKDADNRRLFPLQGWAFVGGFLVFPLWWVAAAAPVGWGWGRRSVSMQDGKGVWTEEELVIREVTEYDVAYAWRQRCRLMSLFGLFVYVPLIVLLAVLARRRT